MKSEDRIKKALEIDAAAFDDISIQNGGVFGVLISILKGKMSRWLIAANVATVIVSVVLAWAGYRFFISNIAEDQIFWGICLLIALNLQIGLKQWLWMEVSRFSLMREIKRVEVAVARIDAVNESV